MSTVVLSTGARTPVGLTAVSSFAAARAGISRLGMHPRWVDKAGAPMRVAMDTRLDDAMPVVERLATLGASAIREALQRLADRGQMEATVYVATPGERPGLSGHDLEIATTKMLAAVGDRLLPERVVPLPRGHAAGLQAFEAAEHDLTTGRSQFVVVVGVDSYLSPATMEWLDETRQLDSEENRLGFVPGEAAAAVVLASHSTAKAFGNSGAVATVRGIGSAREPHPIGTDGVCIGEGLTRAIRNATRALALPREKIAMMHCDINGQRYRTEEFMYVPLRHWGPFVDSNRYSTYVDVWGDVGAATGPLLASQVAMSGLREAAPGRFALLWASSVDGARAALTLEIPSPGVRSWSR